MSAEQESSAHSTAFLALGSNRGPRWKHLRAGRARLDDRRGVEVVKESPVYETEAHTRRPDEHQPPFLNAVVRVETLHSPEDLLRIAHAVERAQDRNRAAQCWAPRVLDVDLLAYEDEVREGSGLRLPHPRLHERRFVLRPWADIAPNFVVPSPFDQSVQTLLEQCPDTASIERTDYEFGESAPLPPNS